MIETKLSKIKNFLNTIPVKIRRKSVVADIIQYKFPYKTEVALRAQAEHDALHYLSGYHFTKEDEEKIVYLEQKFNRGWLAIGKQYNQNIPVSCECNEITQELINETAKIIYSFYDAT